MKKFTPAFANQLKEKASAYASKTWQTWEKSEKGFGRKVYDVAQKLLERVDPDEDVLKAIPSKALGATLSSCEIVYPKSLMHADDVRMAVRDVLKRGKKKARRAKYFNLACAPFTLPLFLSPVSNFPIYWFLYRAREAWIGCKGAESAKEIANALGQLKELPAAPSPEPPPAPAPPPPAPTETTPHEPDPPPRPRRFAGADGKLKINHASADGDASCKTQ